MRELPAPAALQGLSEREGDFQKVVRLPESARKDAKTPDLAPRLRVAAQAVISAQRCAQRLGGRRKLVRPQIARTLAPGRTHDWPCNSNSVCLGSCRLPCASRTIDGLRAFSRNSDAGPDHGAYSPFLPSTKRRAATTEAAAAQAPFQASRPSTLLSSARGFFCHGPHRRLRQAAALLLSPV